MVPQNGNQFVSWCLTVPIAGISGGFITQFTHLLLRRTIDFCSAAI
jgi:hypothetical protein